MKVNVATNKGGGLKNRLLKINLTVPMDLARNLLPKCEVKLIRIDSVCDIESAIPIPRSRRRLGLHSERPNSNSADDLARKTAVPPRRPREMRLRIKCSKCTKIFSRASALALHEKMSHNDKKGVIPRRLQKFKESGPSKKAAGSTTCIPGGTRGGGSRPFGCQQCSKRFKSNCKLLRHQNSHGGRFQCNLCGRNSQSKDILRDHLRIHTGEKPFVCEKCNKKFTFKSGLLRHMREVHEKRRRYLCTTCPLRFISYTQLWVHRQRCARKESS